MEKNGAKEVNKFVTTLLNWGGHLQKKRIYITVTSLSPNYEAKRQ
jgi:hypothetical protein